MQQGGTEGPAGVYADQASAELVEQQGREVVAGVGEEDADEGLTMSVAVVV